MFSVSLDDRHIPDIIIGIIPDNSSGEKSYKIRDTYGQIYSATTRILLDSTQDELQSYHHHIDSEENSSDTTTTTASYP